MADSKWRKSPQSLIETFEVVMPGPPEVERRKMFGYPSCFVNGNLMGGLHESDMILRLSEGDREALLAEGGRPFEPMAGRRMREYIVAPEAMLDDHPRLQDWIAKSLAYASGLPPKTPKPRKPSARKKAAK